MKHLRLILNKSHYNQKRSIQPTEFIRRWSFCHDLACVVKYIARFAQSDSKLSELEIAEWHLLKKIIEEQENLNKKTSTGSSLYDPSLVQDMRHSPFRMMSREIAKEWSLTFHLKEVLFYITTFQNLYHHFPYMRTVLLKQALKNLRQEINAHDQSVNLTTD
jgi:hypothetical protein